MVEITLAPGTTQTIAIDASVSAYRITVLERAELVMHGIVSKPKSVSIELVLAGHQARATVTCLVVLQEQEVTVDVMQRHLVADTQSSVLIKGLLAGTAHARLTGTMDIASTAAGVQASQYHKVLLLSPTAHAVAIPRFAVSNHQVRCNHGAAIGKMNADQIFYLQSRGLSDPVARRMIIYSFVADVGKGVPEYSSDLDDRIAPLLG